MTTTTNVDFDAALRPSRLLAGEIRGELGRLGLNQAELARRLHVTEAWVSRRVGRNADVELTLEETVSMAEALNVSVQRLYAAVLPRLDSNQQPSGYASALVRRVLRSLSRPWVTWRRRQRLGPLAVVVALDEYRLERAS